MYYYILLKKIVYKYYELPIMKINTIYNRSNYIVFSKTMYISMDIVLITLNFDWPVFFKKNVGSKCKYHKPPQKESIYSYLSIKMLYPIQ